MIDRGRYKWILLKGKFWPYLVKMLFSAEMFGTNDTIFAKYQRALPKKARWIANRTAFLLSGRARYHLQIVLDCSERSPV